MSWLSNLFSFLGPSKSYQTGTQLGSISTNAPFNPLPNNVFSKASYTAYELSTLSPDYYLANSLVSGVSGIYQNASFSILSVFNTRLTNTQSVHQYNFFSQVVNLKNTGFIGKSDGSILVSSLINNKPYTYNFIPDYSKPLATTEALLAMKSVTGVIAEEVKEATKKETNKEILKKIFVGILTYGPLVVSALQASGVLKKGQYTDYNNSNNTGNTGSLDLGDGTTTGGKLNVDTSSQFSITDFVTKNAVPLTIGGVLIAGGIAWAASSKPKKRR